MGANRSGQRLIKKRKTAKKHAAAAVRRLSGLAKQSQGAKTKVL